ncbi:DGQHR domain-containing protein DpdB [Bradyrhizobium mercantei]|uniref:DGQHR domain-containing protein DpdB n=1 Tax=Bradyrhizobium mercantei TaxID=1904807 RepID=UPI00097685A2|nr:DGQHR domain-containing protein DpdB [Bradyrhizobium mercantei]
MKAIPCVNVHAIRTRQGGTEVFAFFVPGSRILEIAEIARIKQSTDSQIEGFQRPEIRAHVKAIAEYLAGGDVLFPNAVILAIAGAKFNQKRGTKNETVDGAGDAGVLSIPVRPGRKSAWIVDGQQRALALAESGGSNLPVPVIAFVSSDIAVHREQFILVNKARPLDKRLIDELLPTVGTVLPRDLSARRVPSILCAALADTPNSPFYQLVKRPSHSSPLAVVTDSTLTNLMRRSLQDPRGALAAHVDTDGTADTDAMYRLLVSFWSAVRDAFPGAWGLPPDRSRLMHAAGITAMGVLMDQIMTRYGNFGGDPSAVRSVLTRLAPYCRWTEGRWEALNRDWNDLQSTPKDQRLLSNYLIQLERDVSRASAA